MLKLLEDFVMRGNRDGRGTNAQFETLPVIQEADIRISRCFLYHRPRAKSWEKSRQSYLSCPIQLLNNRLLQVDCREQELICPCKNC